MSDEDLPEPSDRLTRPERWLAERLTAYRVFWIKMAFNVLIIGAFIWAGSLMIDYRGEAQEVHNLVEEKGCGPLPPEWEPEVRGQDSIPEDSNFSREDLWTEQQEVSPSG